MGKKCLKTHFVHFPYFKFTPQAKKYPFLGIYSPTWPLSSTSKLYILCSLCQLIYSTCARFCPVHIPHGSDSFSVFFTLEASFLFSQKWRNQKRSRDPVPLCSILCLCSIVTSCSTLTLSLLFIPLSSGPFPVLSSDQISVPFPAQTFVSIFARFFAHKILRFFFFRFVILISYSYFIRLRICYLSTYISICSQVFLGSGMGNERLANVA